MGIKQHNGNTKADRLAELKIRSPSIQLIKFGRYWFECNYLFPPADSC
ncbi:outer membrane autotransporter/adhesion protein [Escherichia coli]|nr:outer membrane autotransporter/adhesion protein [Escherichia coli]